MLRSLFFVAILCLGTKAFAAVELNKAAPNFTLEGVDVKSKKVEKFTLDKYKDKTVVLEWFNKDCPFVHKMYDAPTKAMAKLQAERVTGKNNVVWFTIVSSAAGKEGFMKPDEAKKVITDYGISSTALLFDSGGKVGQQFGAKTTPHMFIIDKGNLVYQGAIDDKPSADPKTLVGAKNYVAAALDAIATKAPIKDASTTPYGCSVKY